MRVSRDDNISLKEAVDQFFSINQFAPKTVRLFGSANTQAVLDEFSRTGSLPWYMNKKDDKPQPESGGDEYDIFS
ncbi:hypothetical protein RE628_17600 [Paenibacillus sp. D2_2]|uniref:hypothetical protein n=1 Tax=Paenibacillus sp. D2_2 TaxID=3073092 RepID=UPI0028158079|nr:hypothetical protein [Paenibacillus sp. D2_2]WMT39267.1 hypothetical protein RE628_17600 [Paenibacillus sp. D2_2]